MCASLGAALGGPAARCGTAACYTRAAALLRHMHRAQLSPVLHQDFTRTGTEQLLQLHSRVDLRLHLSQAQAPHTHYLTQMLPSFPYFTQRRVGTLCEPPSPLLVWGTFGVPCPVCGWGRFSVGYEPGPCPN